MQDKYQKHEGKEERGRKRLIRREKKEEERGIRR